MRYRLPLLSLCLALASWAACSPPIGRVRPIPCEATDEGCKDNNNTLDPDAGDAGDASDAADDAEDGGGDDADAQDAPTDADATDATDGPDSADGADADADLPAECLDHDEPDPQGLDENCDGIDGDLSKALFVADFGNDDNEGSRARPMKTLQAALARAGEQGKTQLLLAPGQFAGPVTLVDGVGLYGGFDFSWNRSQSARPTIRGGLPAVSGVGLVLPTTLDNLAIEPERRAPVGSNNVAVYLRGSMMVRLSRLRINAGDGGDGTPGTGGEAGLNGLDGGIGAAGCEDDGTITCDECDRPGGGNLGSSLCNNHGGRGGQPGHPGTFAESGEPGQGGAIGGAGGGEDNGLPGNAGGRGGRGAAGNDGTPGGVGADLDGQWVPSAGGVGETGMPGGGGGGGGGGAGVGGTFNCDSWGGGGGGGGGGGCPGTGGTGGSGGGASFGVYLFDSIVEVHACVIAGGRGGTGGDGGRGGNGGPGGVGAAGGPGEDGSGAGGRGGDGGPGGNGGNGGPGAGGPSVGVYSNQPWLMPPTDCEITVGAGGLGGFGATQEGPDGLATDLWPEP